MSTSVLTLFIVSLGSLLLGGSSKTAPPTRQRAKAKTVQNSDAKPYDQGVGPKLMEVHLNEVFRGDIDGESPVRALEVHRDDHSASLVSGQRFAEDWRDGRAPSCCTGRRSSSKARSRRRGLWFRDQARASFRVCAARADLRVTLEKAPRERWSIGSSEWALRTAGGPRRYPGAQRSIRPSQTSARDMDRPGRIVGRASGTPVAPDRKGREFVTVSTTMSLWGVDQRVHEGYKRTTGRLGPMV